MTLPPSSGNAITMFWGMWRGFLLYSSLIFSIPTLAQPVVDIQFQPGQLAGMNGYTIEYCSRLDCPTTTEPQQWVKISQQTCSLVFSGASFEWADQRALSTGHKITYLGWKPLESIRGLTLDSASHKTLMGFLEFTQDVFMATFAIERHHGPHLSTIEEHLLVYSVHDNFVLVMQTR